MLTDLTSSARHRRQKKALETLHRLWYIEHKEGHLLVTDALQEPTPKVELPKRGLPLSERRPSWLRQGGHYFFRLCSLSLSRKASNAITKLPKEISKPIIPINIKMISAAVIGATSLPMYSGKPVIGSGGYHPCHGFHIGILPQSDRNFNQIIFSWNIWKVFQNQSQNNLTEQK